MKGMEKRGRNLALTATGAISRVSMRMGSFSEKTVSVEEVSGEGAKGLRVRRGMFLELFDYLLVAVRGYYCMQR